MTVVFRMCLFFTCYTVSPEKLLGVGRKSLLFFFLISFKKIIYVKSTDFTYMSTTTWVQSPSTSVSSSLAAPLRTQLPAGMLEKAREQGPGAWAPATCLAGLDGFPGSCLRPSTALNQQLDLCLSLCVIPPFR